jgi:uncharacterized protein YdhG (YjbR/CyaY superfamily)
VSTTAKRPTTIAEYIKAAPKAGQPHLRKLHALLKRAAPHAQEAIKWGTPFFVEPRFLFAFSAHKAHASLAPTAGAMKAFGKALEAHQTTKGTIRFLYDEPLPETLILDIAAYCVREVGERKDDAFW